MTKPEWSKRGQFAPLMPEGQSAFERFVYAENIARDQWKKSTRVREWCRKNVHKHWVPEDLIDAFGLR